MLYLCTKPPIGFFWLFNFIRVIVRIEWDGIMRKDFFFVNICRIGMSFFPLNSVYLKKLPNHLITILWAMELKAGSMARWRISVHVKCCCLPLTPYSDSDDDETIFDRTNAIRRWFITYIFAWSIFVIPYNNMHILKYLMFVNRSFLIE